MKKASGSVDVYYAFNPITYNSKTHIARRSKDNVAALRCLYVDLDYYKIKGLNQKKVLTVIKDLYKDGKIPFPDVIKDSGRGLTLQWLFKENEHIKTIKRWRIAQRYLYNLFKPYGADSAVTEDESRLTRVPGTYNGNSGNLVKILYINNEPSLTLYKFIADYVGDYKQTDKHVNNIISLTGDPLQKINIARIRDLEQILLKERDIKDYRRELTSFCIVNLAMQSGYTREQAYNKICNLHKMMNNPLSEAELRGICNGRKIGQYKLSNSKIIEMLDLRDDELVHNKSIISEKMKADRKCIYNRERYYKELDKCGKATKYESMSKALDIMQDMLTDGAKAKEICEVLNISRSTYYNYLNILKDRDEYDRIHEIKHNIAPKRQLNSKRGNSIPAERKNAVEGKNEAKTAAEIIEYPLIDDCPNNFVFISKKIIPTKEIDSLVKGLCDGFVSITDSDKCPFIKSPIDTAVKPCRRIVHNGFGWGWNHNKRTRHIRHIEIPNLDKVPGLDEWGDLPDVLRDCKIV